MKNKCKFFYIIFFLIVILFNVNQVTYSAGVAVYDQQLDGEKIEPVIPFSSIQEIGGADWQFDLFGMKIAKSALNVKGGKEYLANNTGPENFISLLESLQYDNWQDVQEFISKLRELNDLVSKYFGIKETFKINADAAKERIERNQFVELETIKGFLSALWLIIGIILMILAFTLLILGIIDASGTTIEWLNKGLSKAGTNINNEAVYIFGIRRAIVITAVEMIALSIVCLSPSLRAWLLDKFLFVMNWFKNLITTNWEEASTKIKTTLGE